jgi:hypothetical protein
MALIKKKIRQVEHLKAAGKTAIAGCKKVGLTTNYYYKFRKQADVSIAKMSDSGPIKFNLAVPGKEKEKDQEMNLKICTTNLELVRENQVLRKIIIDQALRLTRQGPDFGKANIAGEDKPLVKWLNDVRQSV